MRTIVDSLEPLAGRGSLGARLQHRNLRPACLHESAAESDGSQYLENTAPGGTKIQEILNGAASLLFRGADVKKKVSVLSGGERARLCLAGLMLSQYNILILDEPGNHLDVESVDSLAEALLAYKGTVIFTSHDRYFLKRVATSIIEVRDGPGRQLPWRLRGVSLLRYQGDRRRRTRDGHPDGETSEGSLESQERTRSRAGRSEQELRKEIYNVEKAIAKLDEQKKLANAQLLSATDPKDALRLHHELSEVAKQLGVAEERWCTLFEELGESH